MNEELEQRARSSGLGQRKDDKKGNRLNFGAVDELDSFLIRRQLLTMERKRIQTVLADTEAEVKVREGDLVYLRDGVLTALREHLGRQEEVARVESLNSQKLENLPRNAERYLRRRVKKLLAHLKPDSAADPDRSEVFRVQDPGWHLPKVQQLTAWTEWFAEYERPSRKPPRFRKNRIQVALVVSGGLGDLLKSTHLVGPISDHFACDLTIIAAQSAVGEVVAHNPYVTDTLVPVSFHVFRFTEGLRNIPVFDLIIVWKYVIQYIMPPGSRIPYAYIRSIEEKASDLREVLENYSFLFGWPTFNFAFARDTIKLGLSAMKASVATSGLPHYNPDEIPFFPSKESFRAISGFLTKRYVTVHHGFDLKHLPAKTRETDYSSTKNLSMEQWQRIVALIQKEGVEVIQLGIVEEEKIPGVTHCLNGQTSFEETGLLIKHSLCHIDTEGGLVHLANAVHGRCVVLFGPTPVEFFGYPQNINLEPSGCKACWFVTQTWLIECPRYTSGPECMRGHSAASVANAVKRIIAESENLSAQVIVAETQPSPAQLAETVGKAQTLLGRDAARQILLIFDDLQSDIGSAVPENVLERSDLILCAEKQPELELHDAIADRLEYGSLLNLPRASSTVDAAVLVSRELEPDIAPFALREIFRVLRPGGQFVFAALGESVGLDLRRSLSAARIAFDESEMPSAPVCSCSLRKNGAQAQGVPARSGSAVSVRSPRTAHEHGNAVDPRLALLEKENVRQITLVRDQFVQWEKVMGEARAVVDDAVQHGFGGDGWIWISNLFADGYPTKFFMSGWDSALDWVIWSRENKSLLMLPLPEDQPSRSHRLELQLHLALPQTSVSNPTTIGVRVNDGPIENFHLSTDDEILTVLSSTDASKFRGISLVEFHLGAETSPGESKRLSGSMGMGVKRFRYRVLSS